MKELFMVESQKDKILKTGDANSTSCGKKYSNFGFFVRLSFLTILLIFFSHYAMAAELTRSAAEDVNIPDQGSASSVINFNSDDFSCGTAITSVDVSYDIVHTYSNDLIVTIEHPDGTNYTLRNREGGSADDPSDTVNGITTFNGKFPGGLWSFNVSDAASRDTGYIDNVVVTIHYKSNCLTVLDDLAIQNLCLSYEGNTYNVDLVYVDGAWDLGSVTSGESTEACIEIDNSLTINIPCINFYEYCLQVELIFSPSNLQWTLGAVNVLEFDECGVLAGDGSTCAGCDGVANSGLEFDECGICGGDGSTCGCDGVANSGLEFDECGVCGGDGSSCASSCNQCCTYSWSCRFRNQYGSGTQTGSSTTTSYGGCLNCTESWAYNEIVNDPTSDCVSNIVITNVGPCD